MGPYEIVALLGAGGMGEVYRARDGKLQREVALKILPDEFAGDADRMARFRREAELLASLNHPHIAQIYAVEENALVMELVAGEMLSGPLPLEEAMRIAAQIADALEAAHERGIVHRDLKPANIMITPAGEVKVLDFGLAAVIQGPPSTGHDPTHSPTLTLRATQAGMILGTAAYMAPEQARGKSVDKRADIWAFGVVLYEMLTGKRLFDGETISDTLAAVLKSEPDLTQVPPQARRLLRLCLEKDPKRRLHDIADFRILCQEPPPQAEAALPPRRALAWIGVSGVLFLVALTLAFVHFRETSSEMRAIITTVLPPTGYTLNFGTNQAFALPAISPDGKRIVFGAVSKDGKSQLWLRSLDSATAQSLNGSEGAVSPFWSPDSRYIGFGSADNKLKKIDIQGGPPVTLTDLAAPLRGASWSLEGVILFGLNGNGPIQRISAAGGKASPATTPELGQGQYGDRNPWLLPDGRHFLYIAPQLGEESEVRVGSLDVPNKPGKIVATATSNAMYSRGALLFLRENTLMAQPFDADRLNTTGEAVPIAEEIPHFLQPSRTGAFSVSQSGLLVYQSGSVTGGRFRLEWIGRNGKVLGTLGEPVIFPSDLQLSPDQKSLALAIFEGNNRDIWIYDVVRGLRSRFTFDALPDDGPLWSPDGRAIVWSSRRSGSWALFRKPSDGNGTDEVLYSDSADLSRKVATSWSPDGKFLLYTNTGAITANDVWVLPIASKQPDLPSKPFPLVRSSFQEGYAVFSPDGRWVAYNSNESGQIEVYVIPFAGVSSATGGKRQISNHGGSRPRWRADGKEIFYLSSGQLMAAEVNIRNGALESGRVQTLFGGIGVTIGYTYDASGDGQKFIVVRDSDPESSGAPPLTLVQNWTALLKK